MLKWNWLSLAGLVGAALTAVIAVGNDERPRRARPVAKSDDTVHVMSPSIPGTAGPDTAGRSERSGVRGKIFGTDDRFLIGDTTVLPWSTVCKVFMTYPDGYEAIGSGVMVGPSAMLTAGHVVYSAEHGGWADTVEVIPGYDDGYRPWGTAYASTMWAFNGWINNSSFDWDMGVAILDRRIGDSSGWLGMAVRDDATLRSWTINTGGFPGDVSYGENMIGANGPLDSVTTNQLYWTGTMDLAKGQSGSGLWIIENSTRYVVGVLTSEYPTTNAGCRMNREKFEYVYAWRDGFDGPADLRASSVSSSLPANVELGAAGSASALASNFGDATTTATFELFLVDALGSRWLLDTRSVAPGSFSSQSATFGFTVPTGAEPGPAHLEAQVNRDWSAHEWPLDNNTSSGATFTILPPWSVATLGRWTWDYLAGGASARYRFTVDAARKSLRLNLTTKRGFATVTRPDGSSFTVPKGAAGVTVKYPALGTWSVSVTNSDSRLRTAKFRAKLSTR